MNEIYSNFKKYDNKYLSYKKNENKALKKKRKVFLSSCVNIF